MAKNPAVSVVVPVYNVEIYIRQCVDSILNQTFQDFEIILVDDASPDNSIAICKKFYGDNDKVKFVHHEKNCGLGITRNTGMKHARGKYIYFVDSDDFILPQALEKFYNAAEKNNAQVVHSAGWYDLNQDEPEPVLQENLKQEWDGYNQEGFLTKNLIYRLENHWKTYRTWPMAWLHFCRRDFLEKNHLEFWDIISEDEPFCFELFCLTERYYILHEALYVYRRRSGSIMKSTSLDKFEKAIRSLVVGSKRFEKLLDRIQRFDNYDAWRESITNVFFSRLYKHTLLFYNDPNIGAVRNAVIEETLTPVFGDNEPFVRYFFNGFHLYRRQAEILSRSKNQLSAQMMSIFNRMEISDRKIVFVNFLGRGYGCNPKYIAEEILRQNLPFDLVWLVRNLDEPMPEKIRKVLYGSLDSIYELATAKVIVTNIKNLLPFKNKKQGQYLIMTWHSGTGFKRGEKDAEEKLSPVYVEQSKLNSEMTDLMIASCQEQFDEFRRAFWYKGEILKCGLPRNDIFFNRSEELVANIRKTINIPADSQIIMYAPTFRDNPKILADVYKFDIEKLFKVLKKKFGGKWTLLMRFHPNVAATAFAKESFNGSENVINVTDYPDMQELILVSDVLISDYSSVIYDFMISDKPVFIFAKDYDTYPKERGFKQTYFDLPYKINRTEDELFTCIKTFNKTKSEPAIKKFLDDVKPFDTGHASAEVVKRIADVIEGREQSPEEIFRRLLANPVFKSNLDLLSKIPLQDKI